MNQEILTDNGLILTQAAWEKYCQKSDAILCSPRYTDADFAQHREMYAAAFPERPLRGHFSFKFYPKYSILLGDNVDGIFEQLIVPTERSRALVIGASGANLLLALLAGYKEVDVVDIESAQIGWCYTLMVFILLVDQENLLQAVNAFNKSQYLFRSYDSIQLPEVRSKMLARTANACEYLGIPPEYQIMVRQNIQYIGFRVFSQLFESQTEFLTGYETIRVNLLTKQLPRLILGDLFKQVAASPGRYDAIVTSNVFEWSRLRLTDFCQKVAVGLTSGGVANASSVSRDFSLGSLRGKFTILDDLGKDSGSWKKTGF